MPGGVGAGEEIAKEIDIDFPSSVGSFNRRGRVELKEVGPNVTVLPRLGYVCCVPF